MTGQVNTRNPRITRVRIPTRNKRIRTDLTDRHAKQAGAAGDSSYPAARLARCCPLIRWRPRSLCSRCDSLLTCFPYGVFSVTSV